MYQVSDVTGKTYNDEDMVFFRNYVQAAYYISWGVELVDLFVDSSMKLVFVFSKEDHERLKHKWINKNNAYHAQKNSGDQDG